MLVEPKGAPVLPLNGCIAETENRFIDLKYPRSTRLTTAGAYRRVFSEPPYVSRNRGWTILSTPGEQTHARLGIVVAKRKVRRAVDRNRLKRLVRESFRVNVAQLPDWDIVILIQTAANTMKNDDFVQRLSREWAKLSRAANHAEAIVPSRASPES
ncbi:MAG: ribonuclease P protein component [Thiotrichales bacterium]